MGLSPLNQKVRSHPGGHGQTRPRSSATQGSAERVHWRHCARRQKLRRGNHRLVAARRSGTTITSFIDGRTQVVGGFQLRALPVDDETDRELDQCRSPFVGLSMRASEIGQLLSAPTVQSSQRHFHPVTPGRLTLVERAIGPGNGVAQRLLSTVLGDTDGQGHTDFITVTVNHQRLDRLAYALSAYSRLIKVGFRQYRQKLFATPTTNKILLAH